MHIFYWKYIICFIALTCSFKRRQAWGFTSIIPKLGRWDKRIGSKTDLTAQQVWSWLQLPKTLSQKTVIVYSEMAMCFISLTRISNLKIYCVLSSLCVHAHMYVYMSVCARACVNVKLSIFHYVFIHHTCVGSKKFYRAYPAILMNNKNIPKTQRLKK